MGKWEKSSRKRVKKALLRKAHQHKKPKTKVEKLRWYLSIIDDFNRKLFNFNNYPDIYDEDSDMLLDLFIKPENSPDQTHRVDLWNIANDDSDNRVTDELLEEMQYDIIESYQNWATWIVYSEYKNEYPELIDSLHPATQSSLPKIIPDYLSPDHIRVLHELESAFDPDEHSDLGVSDIEEFKKVEPKNFQKLAKSVIKDHQNVINDHKKIIDLIRKYVPKAREDLWPRGWMMNNRAIMKNLERYKPFLPFLNHITESAYHKFDINTQKFDGYRKAGKDGKVKVYKHIVVKFDAAKIAKKMKVSEPTVRKYMTAMVKNKFVKLMTRPYYAIGYWGDGGNKNFFIKNTKKIREKLTQFKI